jgi:D-sedoheptulose 7-phosphate isomerase
MPDSFYHQFLDSLRAVLEGTEFYDLQGGRIEAGPGLERLTALSRGVQQTGATQYLVGNGASAAFASHMALDWTKNGKVRSLAANDAVWHTALANDRGGEEVFAAFLEIHARAGDLLITISSSGNSANIIKAIVKARALGLTVVTLSGLRPDNQSRALGDLNLYSPAKTYGMVECAHQVLLHVWLDHFMNVAEWNRTEHQNMKATEYRP